VKATATAAPLLSTPTRTHRPLRLGVIAPSRHPIRQPYAGGQEAIVGQLVIRLRQRGHHVTFFAGEGSDHADPDYAFPLTAWAPSSEAAQDQSMPADGFMRDHHSHLRLMMALAGPLSGAFDLVHNHSLHHLPVAMAPLLGTTVLTTLHTPPTPWLESAIHSAPGSGGLRFASVSRFVAHQWRTLAARRRPHVVLNGVDLDAWSPGPGGGPLVWFGRLVPEKAPHLAVRAARLAARPLVLAGPISDREYFQQVVRPLLDDEVEYAGHLGIPDLSRLVGSAVAALVTPVWDEPYGLVVAEAVACGTPVVSFARGGIPEVMGSPLRGAEDDDVSVLTPAGALVPPGDVTAMAAAVDDAVQLDREAVRTFAERTLSIDRTVTRYERHYRRLLSGSTWEADRTA
jgi:glycosyltransferase involved in cell wall biosynthesis